jgi:Zn-dependent protease with chaperone function
MNTLTNSLREFSGLSRHAFQHPLDSKALVALKQVPALPTVLKFLSEKTTERFHHARRMSHSLRVNAQQYPSLYKKYVRMAQILDVQKLPSLFIEMKPVVNAYATGMENYSIVVASALLDVMEDEEVMAILGHELGHVKCEHMLYNSMAHQLGALGGMGASLLSEIPFLGKAITGGLGLALYEWSRKAELSCDRAALIAVQDVDAVASALAKFSGYSKKYAHEMNLDAIEQQADDYETLKQDSLLVNLVMLNELLATTHPYPVVRVREIRRYASSPEYAKILNGDYKREQPKLTDGTWSNAVVSTARFKNCTACSYPCNEDFVFCPNCQANTRDVKLHCSSCKQPVESAWGHCMQCGVQLTTPQLEARQ